MAIFGHVVHVWLVSKSSSKEDEKPHEVSIVYNYLMTREGGGL
tara:strand:+ start:7945 stop:8073 length:129 start_codon:yes stop_codon:yes gene_type:complete